MCCGSEEHEQGKLRMATSDSGTGYIALLSHFFRSKKRVNIHSFCEDCVCEDDMKELKEIQISRLEVEMKAHGKRKAWTRQEWRVWVLSEQYKQLKFDFLHGGKICLLFPSEPCPNHWDGHTLHVVAGTAT